MTKVIILLLLLIASSSPLNASSPDVNGDTVMLDGEQTGVATNQIESRVLSSGGRQTKGPIPSDPLSVNLLCLGLACDIIKCHQDSDCPPYHECTGSSTNRFTTAGGILGSPLSSLDIPFNPLRSSGGFFATLPHLFEGGLDGAWSTVAPRLARPLGELRNTRYCVMVHDDQYYPNTIPVGSNYEYMRTQNLKNRIYRTSESSEGVDGIRGEDASYAQQMNALHSSFKNEASPESFSISFGDPERIKQLNAVHQEVEEGAVKANIPVVQQSGKYVTFETIHDEKGVPYVMQKPIYQEMTSTLKASDRELVSEDSTSEASPSSSPTSDTSEIPPWEPYLSIFKGEQIDAPTAAQLQAKADELIEGQTSTLFNVFNAASDLQINCKNPVNTSIVGNFYTLRLAPNATTNNSYVTDVFDIVPFKRDTFKEPLFVYVKEGFAKQNIASTVDIFCTEEGRFPVGFQIFAFYGLEFQAAYKICFAEAICESVPTTPTIRASSTRDSFDSSTPIEYQLYQRGGKVAHSNSAKKFQIQFNPHNSLKSLEEHQIEVDNPVSLNLQDTIKYIRSGISDAISSIASPVTSIFPFIDAPKSIVCNPILLSAEVGDELQLNSIPLFRFSKEQLNLEATDQRYYEVPAIFKNVYIEEDGSARGTYYCDSSKSDTQDIVIRGKSHEIVAKCPITIRCEDNA